LDVDANAPLPLAPALVHLQTVAGPRQIVRAPWPRRAGRACARPSARTRRIPQSGNPRRTLRSTGPRGRRSQRFPFPERPHRLPTGENIRIA